MLNNVPLCRECESSVMTTKYVYEGEPKPVSNYQQKRIDEITNRGIEQLGEIEPKPAVVKREPFRGIEVLPYRLKDNTWKQ